MPKTLDDIVADIIEHVGTDTERAESLAQKIRESVKLVAQPLINAGVALEKRETKAKLARYETALGETKEKLAATEQEFTQFKEKVPNVRDVEEAERKKWEPRLLKEKDRADKAEGGVRKLREQVFKDKFEARLTRPDAQNVRVDNDPLIVRGIIEEFKDRYVQKEDGTEEVLQIDSDTPYDGRTIDDKINALADAARRKVSSKFLITGTDSGAGVSGSRTGGARDGGTLTPDQVLEKRRSDPQFVGF